MRTLTAAQEALAAHMPESELEINVASLCKTLRVLRYHTHTAIHSPSGFPDDVLVGNGRILYRELKRQGKNPTPAQQTWLDELTEAGQDAAVWRPVDWFSGRIEAEVRALVPRR